MVWTLWLLWGIVAIGGAIAFAIASGGHRPTFVAVLVFMVLAFWLRGGFGSEYFYGLEYEDAYVYAVGARHLTATTPVWNSPGLAVCVVGSIANCREFEVYPGHLLGFPAALRAAEDIWGYSPTLAPFVGSLLSSWAVAAVAWAALATTESYYAAAAAAGLFAVTPVLVVYGGSACSESSTALPIAVAIGAMAMARRSLRRHAWWMWQVFAMSAALLAASVRRENAVLLLIIPLCLMIGARVRFRRLDKIIASALWVSLGLLVSQPLFGSFISELGEFGGASFGVARLISTIPTVMQSMTLPTWFGVLGVAGGGGVCVALAKLSGHRRENDVVAVCGIAVLALGMICLYASHVRSAYQLAGEQVMPFDFMRYLSNLGAPLSVLAASALPVRLPDWVTPNVRRCAIVIALSLMASSALVARDLRAELIDEEISVRRTPALSALELAQTFSWKYPVVTTEPLLMHVYGPPFGRVVSLGALTSQQREAIGGTVLYVSYQRYDSDVDRRRYAEGLLAMSRGHARELRRGDGWTIWMNNLSQIATAEDLVGGR